ncbi:MAG TPA: Na+/H+ antiporter NhaA [Candidatus Binatia bacterium]
MARGLALLACTVVALALANSPWAGVYARLLEMPIGVGLPGHALVLSLRHWIDDAAMAVFFLLVGLEIKRELLGGELKSARGAALPIAGALGGTLLPALLYVVVNGSGEGARGWAIPMATDIAFALGILALLGPRVPVGLRAFLAALAIVDDVGAVLVIAVFYTAELHVTALAAAGAITTALVALNRAGVRSLLPYLALGVGLWMAVHASGVHATVAGVVLAMTIPWHPGRDATDSESPLVRLEHAIDRPVGFVVMPVFALASAGVGLTAFGDALGSPIALGIALGLVVGKPLGITLASWLAVRSGLATLPARVTWASLHGVSWLAGIGFTMALFIATLAFETTPRLAIAKAAILAASIVAGALGYEILRRHAAA